MIKDWTCMKTSSIKDWTMIKEARWTPPNLGKANESSHIRWHIFATSIRVWDLTNAGKRGKKVDTFALWGLDYISDVDVQASLAKWIKNTLPKKELKQLRKQLSGLSLQGDKLHDTAAIAHDHQEKRREFQHELQKTLHRLEQFSQQIQQETACTGETSEAVEKLRRRIVELETALREATGKIEALTSLKTQFDQYKHLLQHLQNPQVMAAIQDAQRQQGQ